MTRWILILMVLLSGCASHQPVVIEEPAPTCEVSDGAWICPDKDCWVYIITSDGQEYAYPIPEDILDRACGRVRI